MGDKRKPQSTVVPSETREELLGVIARLERVATELSTKDFLPHATRVNTLLSRRNDLVGAMWTVVHQMRALETQGKDISEATQAESYAVGAIRCLERIVGTEDEPCDEEG